MNLDEPSDPDIDAFIRGEADTFPEFAPIRPVLHQRAANEFPWYELGDSGGRLIRFAHRFGTFDWRLLIPRIRVDSLREHPCASTIMSC
jgi:hypothetical protein